MVQTPLDGPAGSDPSPGVWSALISEPGLGVSVVDHERRVLYVNNQAVAMLLGGGAGVERVTGKRLDELLPREWVEERARLMQQIQESGTPILLRTIWQGHQQFSWIYGIEPEQGETPPPGLRYSQFLVLIRRGPLPTPDGPDSAYHFQESGIARLGPLEVLTARELEVLALIGQGLSAKEISKVLHRSVRTIEGHRMSLGRKLDIDDRVKLAEIARQAGLTLRDAERRRV